MSSKHLHLFLSVVGSALCANLALAQEQPLGASVYQRMCAQCHGLDGHPPATVTGLLSPPPTDLVDGPYVYGESLEDITGTVAKGLGANMFRFDNRLSSEQINAVAEYVRMLRRQEKASGRK